MPHEVTPYSSAPLAKLGDVQSIEQFDALIKVLYDRAKRPRQKVTPEDRTDKKGEFTFADWDYMLDEMDKEHPLRAETFVQAPTLLEKPMAYFCAVEVRDLITGEVRIGCDMHTIPAYEQGSTVMKDIKSVRELMGNAAKASITKALRHAYSYFGVAADLYGSMNFEPKTTEQEALWLEYDTLITEFLRDHPMPQVEQYMNETRERWKSQYKQTADKFLKTVEPLYLKLKTSKEKQHG